MKSVKYVKNNDLSKLKEGRVLLDFWADWCWPCKEMDKLLKKLNQTGTDLTIAKCDIEKNESLADEFKITSIPTIVLLNDGIEERRSVGVMSKSELNKFIRD